MLERCAGLDVHQETVTACVRVPGAHGDGVQHVRSFDITTAVLLVLRDWLAAHGVTHVAMAATRSLASSVLIQVAVRCQWAFALGVTHGRLHRQRQSGTCQ